MKSIQPGTVVQFNFKGQTITGKVAMDNRRFINGTAHDKTTMVEVRWPGAKTWSKAVIPTENLQLVS